MFLPPCRRQPAPLSQNICVLGLWTAAPESCPAFVRRKNAKLESSLRSELSSTWLACLLWGGVATHTQRHVWWQTSNEQPLLKTSALPRADGSAGCKRLRCVSFCGRWSGGVISYLLQNKVWVRKYRWGTLTVSNQVLSGCSALGGDHVRCDIRTQLSVTVTRWPGERRCFPGTSFRRGCGSSLCSECSGKRVLYGGVSFFLKRFYQSIVGLQCCVCFRWIVKWVSYACTYAHPVIESFPI